MNTALLKDYISRNITDTFREAGGGIPYPFFTPGSHQYADQLWDWDSWLFNIALRQYFLEAGDGAALDKARIYERGCILNWLSVARKTNARGWVPVIMTRGGGDVPADIYADNMHKPCLAQHAAFLVRQDGGDIGWLREDLMYLQYFVNNYRNHHRHPCGLYFWQNDTGIGVDDDPCTMSRPPRSSASIYLNCLMVRELQALVYLLDLAGLDDCAAEYRRDAEHLIAAIQEHCWDERDGFFYSVDVNLLPNPVGRWALHSGEPRSWPGLIQRIGVWSGFLAMWAGVATREQAGRMVAEHYRNPATFHAPFGVRTLSKMEKMYAIRATGNPSCWRGPIWVISNYMVHRGLDAYGFRDDARDLAEKTVRLLVRDVERSGAMHEYYQPENGEPVLNIGFQNWNFLVLNLMAWLEGRPAVSEFDGCVRPPS
ncbi:MAG TPA: trehalase family glycosidase [Kiritimatiellia bacterium]|nr:trehalase family glycosidase [Kiritimatiellia bacterium]HMO97619.1 trehalase family glycosidase [Kiritimatiellia bacterium]HMP95979.1 trehalase family glycosidase [Kiritimatiellia bacterium]